MPDFSGNSNPFDILSNLRFSDEDYIERNEDKQKIAEPDNSYRKSMKIRIWLEKKKRAGKPVSVIKGIEEDKETMKSLAKTIKTQLGVGGSFSGDEIIIQGQNRDKIIEILKSQGFSDVKKAGG